MKKTVFLIVLAASITGLALDVPQGAVIQTAVQKTEVQTVSVTDIRVSELTALMAGSSNRTENVYQIKMHLTTADGQKLQKVMRVSEAQAAVMMDAAGYSLSNIIASASAAVQMIVNQQFGVTP